MPTAYLSRRRTSKFSLKKIVLEKSALIHSILHKTGTITSGFEGKKRKYHFLKNRAILWYALSRAVHKNRTSQVRFSPSKPDLIRPKNTYLIVIGFLQAFIEPWEPNDRLHGIPGHDPQVGKPENVAKRGQEIHAERTAAKIWNHVNTQNRNQQFRFCLEIYFIFFKNRNYQFLKMKFTMWYNFFNGLQQKTGSITSAFLQPKTGGTTS